MPVSTLSRPQPRFFASASGRLRRAAALAAVLPALACGGDVESRMAEVRALQDVGQFNASIDELREILAVAPDLPEATYRLGVALVQTGEPSRAVWALEKAAESPEYAVPASLLLASAHFGSGNYEATVKAADRVLEQDPDRIVALQMRAKGNLGAGHADQALVDTQRLLELSPDDYGVQVLWATVLTDLGRLDEAKEAHDRIKQTGIESGDPAVGPRACVAPALFARDQLQDDAKAEELYADCVERFPTNAFVTGEATRFYDHIRKPEKATEVVRNAVEQAPENLSLRSNLSDRLRRQGDAEGAERVLREAAESFKSAGAWNLLAGFYRTEGQPEKALEALGKVAELSGGGDDQLRFTQADLYIDTDQLDRAEELIGMIQEPTYAKLLRGRILLARGDAKGALEQFEQGIRAWPNNAGARFLAGQAALELGDFDRAVSELREAVRVDNAGTEAAHLLLRLHYGRGEYEEAVRFGKVAARRRGARLDDIFVVGIRAYTELGQWDDARATLESLRQVKGQEKTATLELARVERRAAGPEKAALVIVGAKLDLSDPANIDALDLLCENLVASGERDQALARVDAAIAKHGEVAELHRARGDILFGASRDADARAAYAKASELDPKLASALGGLAALQVRAGDVPGAIERFDAASELAPGVTAYAYSAAQLTLGQGRTEEAETRLREIVKRDASHAGARNDLAWILAEDKRNLDYALVIAEEAQRIDPSPEVLDTLGFVRLQRGESAAAVTVLEQAVQAEAVSPSIRYRLGLALSQTGDTARAREMFQAAIAAGTFPEADDAQRELARLGE
jgi:tetratricopeptide (TPR) repeat protein